MHALSSRTRAQIVATLATLQTGIEPATLTLLVANHAVSPADFGWIVSAGQLGMTCGAMLGWRQIDPSRRAVIGPAIGIGISLALPVAHGLVAVLALRLMLGLVMGLLLTRATAIAARERPHNAIGVIYLAQQLLSTAVLAGLPVVAATWGPAAAMASLAAVPLVIALLSRQDNVPSARPVAAGAATAPATAAGNALVPMALMIAVTMMLWSYIATVGEGLGLRAEDVGFAIALGSLASAPAAVLAAYSRPRWPSWLTALACGAGMLSPLLIPAAAGLIGYLAALALFNAGSTFGSIRFSAWAMQADVRQRQFVVLVQCVAMSAGPALGAVSMRAGGLPALGGIAAAALVAATLVAAVRQIDRARPLPLAVVLAG